MECFNRQRVRRTSSAVSCGTLQHIGAPGRSSRCGTAARTRPVNPSNASEIIKQWLDVHHLSSTPMLEDTVDGYPRQAWWNADGETLVESYTVTNMAHGTPLGVDDSERYGAEGAFLIEAGISSSYHIAKFFGVIKPISSIGWKTSLVAASASESSPDIGVIQKAPAEVDGCPEPHHQIRPHAIEIGAVITRAFAAAGFMKTPTAKAVDRRAGS